MNGKLTAMKDLVLGLARLSKFRRPPQDQNLSIGAIIADNAVKFPNRLMLVTDTREVTWGQFNRRANQYAAYFKSQGIGSEDSVAVLMENEVEMLTAFVGLCKIGVLVGLINTSLRQDQLLHCVNTVGGDKIIFGPGCTLALGQILADIGIKDLLYVSESHDELAPSWGTPILEAVDSYLDDNPAETALIHCLSPAYLIFTSGTTGFPKAAVVTHWHWQLASTSFATILIGLKPTDRMYMCLPLFHTAAMLVGFGASTIAGSSIYLAKKFSVTNFWRDIKKSQSTVFVYIGELCRYLLNAPFTEDEQNNSLRACVGNGLVPEIWSAFKERFSVDKIAEYYGSTEGNLAFMNIFNRDCTFGFALGKYKVAKYDVNKDQLVRDSNGACSPVKIGETGLLLTVISEKAPFSGYTDKSATSDKILRDVFEPGDQYFNTGDLIRQVDVGFSLGFSHYQFVDRLGDTFRWKGENISTGEVMEVLNTIPGVAGSCVYGVKVPHTDGRAGMAALVVNSTDFSFSEALDVITEKLTPAARPLFYRILNEFEMTDTHKIKRTELQKEAFEIGLITDSMYLYETTLEKLTPLDFDVYSAIQEKRYKF